VFDKKLSIDGYQPSGRKILIVGTKMKKGLKEKYSITDMCIIKVKF